MLCIEQVVIHGLGCWDLQLWHILGEVRVLLFTLQDLTVTAVQSLILIFGNNYMKGGNVQKSNEKECLR